VARAMSREAGPVCTDVCAHPQRRGRARKNIPAEALSEWRRVVPPLAGIVETARANLATIAVSSTATTPELRQTRAVQNHSGEFPGGRACSPMGESGL